MFCLCEQNAQSELCYNVILLYYIKTYFSFHFMRHSSHLQLRYLGTRKCNFYLPCYCYIYTSRKYAPQILHTCHMCKLLNAHQWGECANTGGSRLSRIFWEHENQSSLLVIWLIYIKLYRKMENKFWKKNLG